MFAAITGLAAVLQASGFAFQAIKYAGVAYLLYMAWATWRDTGALAVDEDARSSSWRSVIYAGITLNLLNPNSPSSSLPFCPSSLPRMSLVRRFTCSASASCSWS